MTLPREFRKPTPEREARTMAWLDIAAGVMLLGVPLSLPLGTPPLPPTALATILGAVVTGVGTIACAAFVLLRTRRGAAAVRSVFLTSGILLMLGAANAGEALLSGRADGGSAICGATIGFILGWWNVWFSLPPATGSAESEGPLP